MSLDTVLTRDMRLKVLVIEVPREPAIVEGRHR